MALQGPSLWEESFKAENDLSAKQFYAMELSAADQVDLCDNAADTVIGILQNKPVAGAAATVRMIGRSQAVAGGVIAVGDLVGTDGNGKLVAKTADKDKVCGIALTAATGDGKIFEVALGVYQGSLSV